MTDENTGTIRLGLLAPFTGIVGLYGEEISRAAKIAADIINEQGGVLSRKLEIIVEDDGSIPETAVPAARKLIQVHKCDAIIGNLLSNSRISVAYQVAEPLHTPYLNFSFYEGSISSPYFFHFAALPNQQIDQMIPYMAQKFGPKMFLAGSDYEWPRGSLDAATRALKRVHGEVVGERYYPMGEADIQNLVREVAKSGADVFVPYFAGQEQIDLLTEFTRQGLKSKMAVVMGHYDEVMVQQLPPKVREGFYSSNTYFMSVETPENIEYLDRMADFEGVTGVWPDGNGTMTNFSEGTFACVMAYAKAVNSAGSLDVTKVLSALRTIDIQSPQGKIFMDPLTQHAAINSYLSCCDSNGRFNIIKKFGLISPVIPVRYTLEEDAVLDEEPEPLSVENKLTVMNNISGQLIDQMEAGTTFSTALNLVDVCMIATDDEGVITQTNAYVESMFGYSPDELEGQSVSILIPPRFRAAHGGHIKGFIQSDKASLLMGERREVFGYKKNGQEFTAEAAISRLTIDDKLSFVVMLRDLSKHKEIEEKLTWQATHDSLTGLPNRTAIVTRLDNALQRSSRTKQEVAVLFLDIDDFKLINDSYGHGVGDDLLKEIAKKLLVIAGRGHTVARFGGDEFVIICDQVKSRHDISALASKINQEIREQVIIDSIEIFPTFSIGIAFGCLGEATAKTLLSNADAAMYQAKEMGRDKWLLFNSEIFHSSREKLNIATGLKNAIQRNELSCVLQPIVDTNTEVLVGTEILLRWNSKHGPIAPDIFIPIAEMTGSINEIGLWVYKQACEAQVRLAEAFKDNPPYVAVNVSSRQLDDDNFLYDILTETQKSKADPKKMVVEITETAFMTDIDTNVRVLNSLGANGFSVAIDDFGTGYSCLSLLTKLPLSILKIDREFVKNLAHSERERTIARAIVGLGTSLGLKIVAEGVENDEQRLILDELGTTNCQGYYYSKPIPLEDLIAKYQLQAKTFDEPVLS